MNLEPFKEDEIVRNYDYIREYEDTEDLEFDTAKTISGDEKRIPTHRKEELYLNAGIENHIDIGIDYQWIETKYLEEIFSEIIHVIKREYEETDHSHSEIHFKPCPHTSDGYYYDTGINEGVREISFRGDGVTEREIRRAVDGMINEMKEKDML